MTDDPLELPAAPARQPFIPPVDAMALAQLLTAAKQAGLGVNTDLIIAVRDHEFRLRRYQKAFDVIEGLYMHLNAEAARRQTELRQEEIRYKSGALKMTPKQWLARQRRETEKTQRIDLARRHFTRVLDGLTVLRAAEDKETAGSS